MLDGIAKLLVGPSSKKSDALVKQVVEASASGVCDRVSIQIESMSLSEARGYIRARAAEVVRRETRKAVSGLSNAPAICSNTLVRMATERLIPIVLKRMSVGVPSTHILPMAA